MALLASTFCLCDQWRGKPRRLNSGIISHVSPVYCLCSLSSNLGIISETLRFQSLTCPTFAEKACVKIWHIQRPSSGLLHEEICPELCLFVCRLCIFGHSELCGLAFGDSVWSSLCSSPWTHGDPPAPISQVCDFMYESPCLAWTWFLF